MNFLERLVGVQQKMRALVARPRLRTLEGSIDVTKRAEAIERGVDPTVQGNVCGAGIARRAGFPDAKKTAERIPGGTAEFRIVALAINRFGDQPADAASDQHVRRKVLLATNASNAHGCGQTVGEKLGHRAGIFVRQNAGSGPGSGGVGLREGISSLEKSTVACALIRA